MPHSPTQVLLVEDSLVALAILKRLLASSPEIKVVGTARNGKEALELIPKVQPAVICTDLHMKEMDGLEFTKQVMAKYPRPILVISTSVQKEDTQNIFRLLEAGAVDVFPKPSTGLASDYERAKRELIDKIKILSGVTVFTRRQQTIAGGTRGPQPPQGVGDRGAKGSRVVGAGFTEDLSISQTTSLNPPSREQGSRVVGTYRQPECTMHLCTCAPPHPRIASIRAIAIGASTGGPQALSTILTQLPVNFPVPVICIQHISEGFLQGLVDWLASQCQLQVKIAQVGELPLPGKIYFAPDKNHLELNPQSRFTYSISPPIDGHRPSVTVTFKSVANFYGRATAGVLLTGMGRDGAEGMRAIASCGGMTIAQDEKSSVVFGMPKEAIALGAAQHILPIHEIAPLLLTKIFVKKS